MLLEPEVAHIEAQRQTKQLGVIQYWHRPEPGVPLAQIGLLFVQIELANRAIGDDDIGPIGPGRAQYGIAHFCGHFRRFDSQESPTTLPLVRIGHRFRSHRRAQIIQCSGIFGVFVGHLFRRSENHAPVIGRDSETGQGVLHCLCDRLKTDLVADDLQHVQNLQITGVVRLNEEVKLLSDALI